MAWCLVKHRYFTIPLPHISTPWSPVVSSLQVFQPNYFMYFSSLPPVLHAPLIFSSLRNGRSANPSIRILRSVKCDNAHPSVHLITSGDVCFILSLHKTVKQTHTAKRKLRMFHIYKVKVRLSLCFIFNWAPRHGGIALRILDVGIRWRWVVSFTHWPLYRQGKSPWYPLHRRLGGPQIRFGRGGEAKYS